MDALGASQVEAEVVIQLQAREGVQTSALAVLNALPRSQLCSVLLGVSATGAPFPGRRPCYGLASCVAPSVGNGLVAGTILKRLQPE